MSKDPKPEPDTEAPAEEIAPKKTSLVVHIVVFLLITGLAAGAGFGVSMFLDPGSSSMTAQQASSKTDASGESDGGQGADDGQESGAEDEGKSEDGEDGVKHAYAKPLAPILTNLAAPDDVWVRMELAVVGKSSLTDALLEQIHQDLFAYMRTVKLHHVEGASGYNNLRAELSERAVVRGGGAVKAVLVRTLVFE